MMQIKQHLKRELVLQWRERRSVLNAGLFFLMILLVFPLSLEADIFLLKKILPGLVWIAALFVFLLSAESIFYQEAEDGVLEQWLLPMVEIQKCVRIKLLVHWINLMLPLCALCFVIALLFNLNGIELGVLMLSLLYGTPTLYMLCAFSAAFGLGLNRQGLFTALILLPLALPVIIFGGGVLTHAMQGIPVSGALALLLALAIGSVWVMPYAISAVIRVGIADVGR